MVPTLDIPISKGKAWRDSVVEQQSSNSNDTPLIGVGLDVN